MGNVQAESVHGKKFCPPWRLTPLVHSSPSVGALLPALCGAAEKSLAPPQVSSDDVAPPCCEEVTSDEDEDGLPKPCFLELREILREQMDA